MRCGRLSHRGRQAANRSENHHHSSGSSGHARRSVSTARSEERVVCSAFALLASSRCPVLFIARPFALLAFFAIE
jgi:hypothetical protein